MGLAATIWVRLNQMGEPVEMTINSNTGAWGRLNLLGHELEMLPTYIHERVALLKLTDVNKESAVETVGRRLSGRYLTVYLSYDEYIETLNIFNGECNEENQ